MYNKYLVNNKEMFINGSVYKQKGDIYKVAIMVLLKGTFHI